MAAFAANIQGLNTAASGMMRCQRDLRVKGELQVWWEVAQGEVQATGRPVNVVDREQYM